MNKYTKLILGVVVFVVLIGGSSILYKNLSSQYGADNFTVIDDRNTHENTVQETNNESFAADDTGVVQEESADEEAMTEGTAETESAETNPVPDFTVYNADGEEVRLSDLIGKPVILNFWASWCGPCKSEMPMFQQMYDTYGEEIAFMMVNLTDGGQETVETAGAYIDGEGYTFPVYFDSKQNAAYAYYVMSIPMTFFIDAEGNFVAYGQGALTEDAFKQGLAMLGY